MASISSLQSVLVLCPIYEYSCYPQYFFISFTCCFCSSSRGKTWLFHVETFILIVVDNKSDSGRVCCASHWVWIGVELIIQGRGRGRVKGGGARMGQGRWEGDAREVWGRSEAEEQAPLPLSPYCSMPRVYWSEQTQNLPSWSVFKLFQSFKISQTFSSRAKMLQRF